MIDPRGMTLRDWCDSVVLDRSDAWSFPVLKDEAGWQDWAVSFLRAARPSRQAPPDPYQFDDWREWAMRAYPLIEVNT